MFFGGGWERRGAAVLRLFWTRHNLACWAAPGEAMVHLSLTPSAFFAGARHGLGGGAGKEGQHGRGAHRPGMPGPHHPPPPPAPQETCSPPNRPQDPGPRGVGDSTGPRAGLCPTSRGREPVAALTAGRPITATALAEGPSGPAAFRAEIVLLLTAAGGWGTCSPNPKVRQGR